MDKDYTVGYGKPPENNRFAKGRSGNPKGRPKGAKNLRSDLTEELAERISIRQGKRTAWISKQRAIVKTLVAETLKGDARVASTLVAMMYRVLDHGNETLPAEEPLDADERELLEALREGLSRNANLARNLGDSTVPKGNGS